MFAVKSLLRRARAAVFVALVWATLAPAGFT